MIFLHDTIATESELIIKACSADAERVLQLETTSYVTAPHTYTSLWRVYFRDFITNRWAHCSKAARGRSTPKQVFKCDTIDRLLFPASSAGKQLPYFLPEHFPQVGLPRVDGERHRNHHQKLENRKRFHVVGLCRVCQSSTLSLPGESAPGCAWSWAFPTGPGWRAPWPAGGRYPGGSGGKNTTNPAQIGDLTFFANAAWLLLSDSPAMKIFPTVAGGAAVACVECCRRCFHVLRICRRPPFPERLPPPPPPRSSSSSCGSSSWGRRGGPEWRRTDRGTVSFIRREKVT